MKSSFILITTTLLFGFLATANAQTRVAVVGDSITAGYGGVSPWWRTLATELGSDYDVQGFGQAGATVSAKGDLPLSTSAIYWDSINFEPDVVLFLLGANDGKQSNWTNTVEFASDYRAIIDTYKALASSPEIYVLTPMPVLNEGDFSILPELVNDGVIPTVRDKVAAMTNGGLIDIAANFPASGNYLDNVHPSAEGARRLAAIVASKRPFGNAGSGGGSTVTEGGGSTSEEVIVTSGGSAGIWKWHEYFGSYFLDGSSPWVYQEDFGWLWPFDKNHKGWFYSDVFRDLIWIDGEDDGPYYYRSKQNRWRRWW